MSRTNQLLAMCGVAISDGSVWVQVDDSAEKRAARRLEDDGLLVVLTGISATFPNTWFICLTPAGIKLLKKVEALHA